jgi:hypothetical protein
MHVPFASLTSPSPSLLDRSRIAAAVLATEFVFPSHAKDLFLTSMAQTMDDLSQLYLAVRNMSVFEVCGRVVMLADLCDDFPHQMSRGNLAGGEYTFDSSSADKIEANVEATVARCSAHLSSLKVEITLIHKVSVKSLYQAFFLDPALTIIFFVPPADPDLSTRCRLRAKARRPADLDQRDPGEDPSRGDRDSGFAGEEGSGMSSFFRDSVYRC